MLLHQAALLPWKAFRSEGQALPLGRFEAGPRGLSRISRAQWGRRTCDAGVVHVAFEGKLGLKGANHS